MLKLLFCCLCVVFLSSAHSEYYSKDVPQDFKDMIKSPMAGGRPGESFAATVTRPFVQDTTAELVFFSKPAESRFFWEAQKESTITTYEIFSTMGISRRGLLDNDSGRYQRIADAQTTGMLDIINGKAFGFGRIGTEDQQKNMAKELLNIGHLMPQRSVLEKLGALRGQYLSLRGDQQKKHIQMCALLMLKGARIDPKRHSDKWYLMGVNERAVSQKLEAYAKEFLPHDPSYEAATTSAVFPARPGDAVISPLNYNGKPQKIYGTAGITGSALHSQLDYARYPSVMVLGSHKVPTKGPDDMFSLTAQISPNHYFMIMRPEDGRTLPVLRPQYGEVNSGGPMTAEGRGETKVTVRYLDDVTEDLTINWQVQKGVEDSSVVLPADLKGLNGALRYSMSQVKPNEQVPNDGQLTLSDARKIKNQDDEETYSLIAILKGAQEKRFYYWCPTPSQLDLLRNFSQKKHESFTLDDLYKHIVTFGEDDAVPKEILDQIQELVNGNLEGFQR